MSNLSKHLVALRVGYTLTFTALLLHLFYSDKVQRLFHTHVSKEQYASPIFASLDQFVTYLVAFVFLVIVYAVSSRTPRLVKAASEGALLFNLFQLVALALYGKPALINVQSAAGAPIVMTLVFAYLLYAHPIKISGPEPASDPFLRTVHYLNIAFIAAFVTSLIFFWDKTVPSLFQKATLKAFEDPFLKASYQYTFVLGAGCLLLWYFVVNACSRTQLSTFTWIAIVIMMSNQIPHLYGGAKAVGMKMNPTVDGFVQVTFLLMYVVGLKNNGPAGLIDDDEPALVDAASPISKPRTPARSRSPSRKKRD